jgi:putative thiamine transport system ATP-binding protein
MTAEPLRLEAVMLEVGGRRLFPPVSETISPGEVMTIMGASGAGKSSLLSFLCGTLSTAFTSSGRVFLGDRDLTRISPEFRRLGILFQDDLLFPHMSVSQNLAFGLEPGVRSKQERRQKIAEALVEAGLEGFEDRDPATLSGGQRARISVMRVLLSQPGALLLDEPFSRLDPANRQRFRDFVLDHARQRRLPTLMVTHEAEDAEAGGGRILRLVSIPS